MNGFETIQFESIGYNARDNEFGVYYLVKKNHLLIDFEEKLQECDYIVVGERQVRSMFDKLSEFEAFARKYGFVARWDHHQDIFVCSKEPPWIE